MKQSTIAAWLNNYNNLKSNPEALDSTDMLLEFPYKPGVDLIRNCDLPPPQKLFTASDKGAMAGRGRGREEVETGGMEEKLELLKALRLSQTRAREAERKAAKLMEERDCISRAFEDEARLIFCYRQSLKLMELRVSKLKKRKEEEEDNGNGNGNGNRGVKWVWALAICLSVVGVGILLGYTCSNVDEDPFVVNT
ncbi:hypothetical protein SDJN03_05903, partial [Cucurbita argyrosperma subsp. sororia]